MAGGNSYKNQLSQNRFLTTAMEALITKNVESYLYPIPKSTCQCSLCPKHSLVVQEWSAARPGESIQHGTTSITYKLFTWIQASLCPCFPGFVNTWHSQSRVSVSKCQSATLLCTWRPCQYISPSPLAAWRSPWPHPQPGQLGDRHGAWWSKRPSRERRHWRKPPTKQGQRKDFFGKLLKKSQRDIYKKGKRNGKNTWTNWE